MEILHLTARVRHVVNVSRVFPLIRDRDRVSVFVQIYVGPRFLGGVMFILVIRCNLGRAGIRGNIATMHRFFARVVTLKGTKLTHYVVAFTNPFRNFPKEKKEIKYYYIVWLKKNRETKNYFDSVRSYVYVY